MIPQLPTTVLVSCRQMQEAEEQAFTRGVSAASLMEQAGLGIAAAIRQFHPRPGTAVLYLGKGNNAGDALVAARELARHGWTLLARLSAPVDQFKPLPLAHWTALASQIRSLSTPPASPSLPPGPLILLDGLLGLGARGPMLPDLAALAAEMNALRRSAHAQVLAMDLPSGLDGDTGLPGPDCVQADLTLTIAHPKSGLLADAATAFVGRLALIPLPELATVAGDPSAGLITPALLRSLLPPRSFDTHKGQAGRLSIVAGSPGFVGAAELACLGALNAGAGMVTLWVKPAAYPLLASRVPAEVMVKSTDHYLDVLNHPHDALAVGPGLGRDSDPEILDLLSRASAPTVVDADALNALAAQLPLRDPPGPRLLTPHPGEWQRLAPDLANSTLPRRHQAQQFAGQHAQTTVLLKGARTIIAQAGRPTLFNSTGHPGMATGGMGDVLTGVLGAFLGQKVPTHDAAALGAWLCGRAAEHAALHQHSFSVLPTTVASLLGAALQDLSENAF